MPSKKTSSSKNLTEKRSHSPALVRVTATDKSNSGHDPTPPPLDAGPRRKSIFKSAASEDNITFGSLPGNHVIRPKKYKDKEMYEQSSSKLVPDSARLTLTPTKMDRQKPVIHVDRHTPRKVAINAQMRMRAERDEAINNFYEDRYDIQKLKNKITVLEEDNGELKNYNNYCLKERDIATRKAGAYLKELDAERKEKEEAKKEIRRLKLFHDSYVLDTRRTLKRALEETGESFIRHKYWYENGGRTLDDLRSKTYIAEAIEQAESKNCKLSDILDVNQDTFCGPINYNVRITGISDGEESEAPGPKMSG